MLSHFSRVWLFATLWTIAYQPPLSMGFSRQEYWSGLPCSPPGYFPDPGIELASLKSSALVGGFFTNRECLVYMCSRYLYVTHLAIWGDLKAWWGGEEDSWWGDLADRKNQPQESIPGSPRGKPGGSLWFRCRNSMGWPQKGVYGGEAPSVRVEITGRPHLDCQEC